MGTDRVTDRRHPSEYNSPSTIPFVITIVLIKEGRAKNLNLIMNRKRDEREIECMKE
jgi:hypothetical protein